jgi:hypothetical protein
MWSCDDPHDVGGVASASGMQGTSVNKTHDHGPAQPYYWIRSIFLARMKVQVRRKESAGLGREAGPRALDYMRRVAFPSFLSMSTCRGPVEL